jgi:hypothetical protein
MSELVCEHRVIQTFGWWKPNLTASTRTLNLNAVTDCRCRVLSRVVFSSAEWFGTEFREFAPIFSPRNGIPSCFLFRWKVWSGIPRVCFFFSSTEWNSELFSLPLKGFGREFREFACIFGLPDGIPSCFLFRRRVWNGIPRISVPRNSGNSVGNNHLFRQFRLPRNYFFVGNSQPYQQPLTSHC